jgi:hypothetical protein
MSARTLVLLAVALAGCQRPVPQQVLQPIPPPLGPMTPPLDALKLQPVPPVPLPATNTCNLEAVAGFPFTAQPVRLYRHAPAPVSGWAALDGSVPDHVNLVAVGAANATWQVALPVRLARDDVAAYFKSPAMRRSGFAAHVDLSGLPPGEYRLMLQYGDGTRARRCDNDRQVQVVD